MIIECLGDDDGDTHPKPVPVRKFPVSTLTTTTHRWLLRDTLMIADRQPVAETPSEPRYHRDIRALGIGPTDRSMEPGVGLRALWDPGANVGDGTAQWRIGSFDEQEDGTHHVVRAVLVGGGVIRWVIDSERGWNAESVEIEVGRMTQSCKVELSEFDGVWFPSRVAYFANGELTTEYVVANAVFRQNDALASFSPEQIGVEVGTQINTHEAGPSHYWNGVDLETGAEFWTRVKQGDVELGSTVRDRRAGIISPYDPRSWGHDVDMTGRTPAEWTDRSSRLTLLLARTMFNSAAAVTPWESNVQQFIRRHELAEDQTQKALIILADCQQQAKRVLTRDKQAWVNLSAAEEAGEQTAQTRASRERLTKPLTDIFEKQLKPRLDKLLTREQRDRAAPDKP